MKISRRDALDYFDHYGYIDLQEEKYYPGERLAQLFLLDSPTSADYTRMQANHERYLRAPIQRAMHIDFVAARRVGVAYDTLIHLGYPECEAYEEFCTPAEETKHCEYMRSLSVDVARHALYDYVEEIGKSHEFHVNLGAVRIEIIRNWFAQYDIEVES